MHDSSDARDPGTLQEPLDQRELAEAGAALGAECARRYASLMQELVQRLFDDNEALARPALDTGSFSLDGQTVVMRLDPDSDMVEFFCDIGQPDFNGVETSYRNLLELNLCRTYPGLVFGVHPESGRIVATASMHALMLANVEMCFGVLQTMIDCVKELIADRVVMLQ